MSVWSKIEKTISTSIGLSFQLKNQTGIGGGSINQANRIDGVLGDENKTISFFIKFNHKNRLEMFEAEAAGLEEIKKSQTIYVPQVICFGVEDNQSYLILENLSLSGGASNSATLLGEQLALMHKTTADQFGWSRNNTIGSTEQINSYANDWPDFFREHRLGFQLDLAKKNGGGRSLINKGEKLISELEIFFIDYEPEASLLHGDLWSGNYGYVENGDPVIFDPAVYYGDRETDVAMTELFGGFSGEFYSAYNSIWPLNNGYKARKTLYNLYHILNHYNLFGGSYAMQAEAMMDKLLAKI